MNSIELGPESEQVKDKLNYFNKLTDESESLINNIDDFFKNLENEIDSWKDKQLKNIDKNYREIKSKVSQIKGDCLSNAPKQINR